MAYFVTGCAGLIVWAIFLLNDIRSDLRFLRDELTRMDADIDDLWGEVFGDEDDPDGLPEPSYSNVIAMQKRAA